MRPAKFAGMLLVFLAVLTAASPLAAPPADGVEFELVVRQRPAALDKYFEVTRDTVRAAADRSLHTFLVNIGLDLRVEAVDTQAVEFTAHLVTVGKTPYNYSNRYRIEYNLPARIENIPGRNDSYYQLLISPRRIVEIDTASCPYDADAESLFTFDPAANFDIYFVENSLADFHWNRIKQYLEAENARFRRLIDLNSPGKISFYLCPCPLNTVAWDDRFGYGLDPGRLRVFSIYTHDYISADAILANMTQLLHFWGYAPPFLVEGLAGYFEFSGYEMKKLRADEAVPDIKKMLTTRGYLRIEPVTAEKVASSFIRYLVDSFGISRLRQVYERSDDLTLLRNIEMVYDMPLDSLRAGWYYYLDTVSLSRSAFDFYAGREATLGRKDKHLEYLTRMLEYDDSRADSIDTRQKLGMANYFYGDYYEAEAAYETLLKIDSSRLEYWQVLGNLRLLNGEYDSAWLAFDSVFALDSTYASARLLQAGIAAIRGDSARALQLAEKYYEIEKSPVARTEFLLFIGRLKESPGPDHDSAAAVRAFSDALIWANDVIRKVPDDPAHMMRVGLAHVGLRQYDKARGYLELAAFIEARAYYRGRMYLELGKLYDLLGERELALEAYRTCLANQSALWQHELSRRYIEQPYSNR